MRQINDILSVEQGQAGFAVFEEDGLFYITRFSQVSFILGPSMDVVDSIGKTVEAIRGCHISDTK